jgi:hypothetical protein
MGAWGDGPFDNDVAADFSAELDETPAAGRAAVIEDALESAAFEEGFLPADVACRAIAAAAVVAAQRPGGPPLDPTYAPQILAEGVVIDLPGDVRDLAVRALDRIAGDDSEWQELWEDGGLSVIDPLRKVLGPVAS